VDYLPMVIQNILVEFHRHKSEGTLKEW
jgi:hypothetical protein